MISAQLNLTGIDTFYEHKHVFRDFITDYQGQQIHAGNAIFNNQIQQFNYTLPANWNAANCEIIAFVHYKNEANKFDILQVAHRKLE